MSENKYNNKHLAILGAIIGDVAGSRFEFNPVKTKNFELLLKGEKCLDSNQTLEEYKNTCHFTDDTVMTIAIANAFLEADGNYNNLSELAIANLKVFGNKYHLAGYGAKFYAWLRSRKMEPYYSCGNGSAMRISPVAYFAESLDEVKQLSNQVTKVTHNHPEGLKGAECVACCVWLSINGYSKNYICKFVEDNYYSLDFDYNDLIANYKHDETCQNSVPQSIFAFLIAEDFEDTIRTVISFGGDADTMACIAGAIAAPYYGITSELESKIYEFLPMDFKNILLKLR